MKRSPMAKLLELLWSSKASQSFKILALTRMKFSYSSRQMPFATHHPIQKTIIFSIDLKRALLLVRTP